MCACISERRFQHYYVCHSKNILSMHLNVSSTLRCYLQNYHLPSENHNLCFIYAVHVYSYSLKYLLYSVKPVFNSSVLCLPGESTISF